MPAGEEVMVPPPVVGTLVTNSSLPKVAVTVLAASIVTVQVLAVPEQPPPDQPMKVEFSLIERVNVTEVPEL